MRRPTGSAFVQATLAFVLLYAAGVKWLAGPGPTQDALVVLGFRDPPLVRAISRWLPAAEALLALWLVSGVRPRASAFTATVVFAGFGSTLVMMGLTRGWQSPCNCLAAPSGTIVGALLRNALLLLGSGWLLITLQSGRAGRSARGRACG
ncbi:MAG: MauE/DoxX family redox-associated membrane protein [Phycisphaerae bacterium]